MDSTRKTQVIASEKSLLEAMRTNDVKLLDKLLHDDLLFNGPNGETATKSVDLANYRSGNINLHAVESSDQLLSVIGDDVVVAVTVQIEGNYMGQELDGKFRYLRVWKRFDESWKVIAGSVVTLGSGG
jgi:ketosteroid isomerase-like protein